MKTSILTCAFLLSTVTASHAATFNGTAQGEWGNVISGGNWVGSGHTIHPDEDGKAIVRWGVETVDGLTHNPGVADYVRETDPNSNHMSFSNGTNWSSGTDMFSLGSFEYHNGSSYNNSHGFEGVSLSIGVTFGTMDTPISLFFDYAFSILSTPNEGASGPDNSDFLFVEDVPGSQYFMVDGQRYMFEILGLSSDGGLTFPSLFEVLEPGEPGAQPALANVYARISPTVVPIPATLPLLLSAVGAVGYVSRRKRKTA